MEAHVTIYGTLLLVTVRGDTKELFVKQVRCKMIIHNFLYIKRIIKFDGPVHKYEKFSLERIHFKQ